MPDAVHKEQWTDVHDSLVRSAQIGTERLPLRLPKVDHPLWSAVSRTGDISDAARLLQGISAWTHWVRAGAEPVDSHATWTVCADETSHILSSKAAAILADQIAGTNRQLIPEFLKAIGSHGFVVPVEILPELLEIGELRPDVRKLVQQVIGVRGAWLAEANADWSPMMSPPDPGLSSTGTKFDALPLAQRTIWLSHWREIHPGIALQFLSSRWSELAADERKKFISMLRIGFSGEDAEFLNACRNDRSAEVRAEAASLGCLLPQSGWVTRMVERLRPLLQITPAKKQLLGLLRAKATLHVSLPEECDAGMQQDGVIEKVKDNDALTGRKAFWLQQMLNFVPPQIWATEANTTPAEFIDLVVKDTFVEPVLRGIVHATLRHQDRVWALAIATHVADWLKPHTLVEICQLLEPAQSNTILVERLQRSEEQREAVLESLSTPWSEPICRWVHNHTLGPAYGFLENHRERRIFALYCVSAPVSLYQATVSACNARESSDQHRMLEMSRCLGLFRDRFEFLTSLEAAASR